MQTLVDLDQNQLDALAEAVPHGRANVQDVYPLTSLQEGMLFHSLLEEAGDSYVLSTLFEALERPYLDRLLNAVERVIARHDVLRTAVLWEGMPRPLQVVLRRASLPIEESVLDPTQETLEQLKAMMRPRRRRFDLTRAPLLRVTVAADPHSDRWFAVLQVHHVICDHQSLAVLVSEILAHVDATERRLPVALPFREHVAMSSREAATDEARTFFRARLADIDEPTAPFGVLDVRSDSDSIDEQLRRCAPNLERAVRAQALRHGVSAARIFHAAWALVIACTSGRDDVVFGTVLLARQRRNSPNGCALGLFVNTLPLRLRLAGATVSELMSQTHQELAQLVVRQATPLTVALGCSSLAAAVPLFTSVLNYRHSAPVGVHASTAAEGVRVLHRAEAWTNYPITMTVDDLGDGFIVQAKTHPGIGAQRMIDYLTTALQSLLDALERAPQSPASKLQVLPQLERCQVIEAFNATAAPWPSDRLIHELIEDQVQRTPEAIAVACGSRSLTYAELNSRANQLARHLRCHGVGPDELVALCIGQRVEMLVGMLGALKAGGAYLPLDPTNPPERLRHILSDAAPRVVLTEARLASLVPANGVYVIAVDGDWHQIATQVATDLTRCSPQVSPRQLAYVIYTSGSTGVPKGVMVEHRNIVNYAIHALRQFDVAAGDGSVISSSISFDLMLTGLYPPLLCGRTVHLSEESHAAAIEDEVLRHRNLSPLKLTPSHVALLEQALLSGALERRVRSLVLGGEPLRRSVVQLWRTYAPGTRIFNHYGPTETTVGCVVNDIADCADELLPIGRPIANTQIYILDRYQNPTPIGVSGEIYVAGAGVARGYLNRPDLTAERFLPDPFGPDPCARMYRTGDIGRWRADGLIEFLGRNDEQIKIRGFRVELSEVQSQLLRNDVVRDGVVVAREDVAGDLRLVAYIVPRSETDCLQPQDLCAQLRAVLPDYMVPSAFVSIPRLPLTPNGKLDRRALPTPTIDDLVSAQYEPPSGAIEHMLADIWCEVLLVERVGRDDDFFDLGGHSLLAMQVVARARSMFQVELPIDSIFKYPTLRELADTLDGLCRASLAGRLAGDPSELDQLLETVASMPESKAEELLRQLMVEGRA